MHWLVVGYIFLVIHRPFEVWPILGALRLERIYMIVTLAAFLAQFVKDGIAWKPNYQHVAYCAFTGAILLSWCLSPFGDSCEDTVVEYCKQLVFYLLLVTVIDDEKQLRAVVKALVWVMAIYMGHSLFEFRNGRHDWQMGIPRMIGVDNTRSNPNSFGLTIAYALPLILPFWRAGVWSRASRLALAGYIGLSAVCIVLTGSRSSLIAFLTFFALVIFRGRRKLLYAALALAAALATWALVPEHLQRRFESIVNPEAGTAGAKMSAEGRIEGFFTGLELWRNYPLTGCGPGAWRPASGSDVEAHNLYGQVLGETGTLGTLAFFLIVACCCGNIWAILVLRKAAVEPDRPDFLAELAVAIGFSLVIMLVAGNFGHSLFRYNWLWYGAILVIGRHCAERARLDRRKEAVPDPEQGAGSGDEGLEDLGRSSPAQDATRFPF